MRFQLEAGPLVSVSGSHPCSRPACLPRTTSDQSPSDLPSKSALSFLFGDITLPPAIELLLSSSSPPYGHGPLCRFTPLKVLSFVLFCVLEKERTSVAFCKPRTNSHSEEEKTLSWELFTKRPLDLQKPRIVPITSKNVRTGCFSSVSEDCNPQSDTVVQASAPHTMASERKAEASSHSYL